MKIRLLSGRDAGRIDESLTHLERAMEADDREKAFHIRHVIQAAAEDEPGEEIRTK